ncbi:uncharacterized protein LOC127870443 [Dreissena polymorpha]|nr:uncharacterized protein LOC127870443 [Dreissena polymorpha]
MIVASTYSGLVELGLKTSTLLASGSIIISGVLILPPVIKVSRDICYVSEDVTSIVDVTGRQLVAVDFPWALMLSAVGLLLAFIAGAIFLIAAFRRDADFMTISPQSFLAPAILSLVTFPAHISVQDRLGHIPPSELKPRSDSFLIPPPIGSHDDAPFSFQNGRLRRETAFDFPPPSFAFFISGENSPTGSSTGMQSRPPSSGRLSCSSDVITATNIPVITVDQTCESTPLTAAESKTKAPDIAKPDTERNTNCDAGNVKNTQKSVTTLSSIFEAKDNNKHTETSVKQDFKSSAKSSFVAATAEPNLRKKTTKQTAVHPIELVTKENKLLDKENTKIVTDKGSTDIKENPIKRSTNISTSSTAKRVKTSPAPKIIVQRYKLRTKSNDGQAPVKQDIKLRKVVKRFKPEMTLGNAINKDNTERESKVVRVPVVTFTNCGCLQGELNVQDISNM